MAYTKQTWTNDVSKVTDTRMTHIEDGIYDNSLATDKINPSGTATTTQTDFTEGQLSQKLGLKYIKMKGQTSQASDPTPTNPVDVNKVSGSNVLKVCNKNLYDKDDITLLYNGYIDATSSTLKSNVNAKTIVMPCKPSTTYTISKVLSNRFITGESTTTGTNASITNTNTSASTTSHTITTSATAKYLCIFYYLSTADTLSEETIRNSIQIEIGSTATSFIAHKEEDYNIDLPVENLLDYANNTIANAMMNTSGGIVTTSQCTTVWAKVKPNKTYTLSRDKGDRIVIGGTNTQPALDGSTTLIKNEGVTDVKEYTFTNGNYNYIAIYISRYTSTKPNWVKLEENSKATAYMDFGEGSLELCKIGDYQDYIYKNNGKWYKHKAIGKVTLDGTETWSYSSGNLVFYTDVINTLAKSNTSLYCTHYKPVDNSTTYANMNSGEIKAQHDNSLNARLMIKNTAITSANDFKTWLASNNTSVYYQLVTPIEEEITYEPLLRQLDKLDKIGLYDISNISQDNSDMKMLLDFTICNDNYNGLREFIRA